MKEDGEWKDGYKSHLNFPCLLHFLEIIIVLHSLDEPELDQFPIQIICYCSVSQSNFLTLRTYFTIQIKKENMSYNSSPAHKALFTKLVLYGVLENNCVTCFKVTPLILKN